MFAHGMKHIEGESCIFIGDTPAKLLFHPSGPVKLIDPASGRSYEEGRDFVLDRISGSIFRAEHSSLPSLAEEDLYPAEKISFYPALDANAVPGGSNGKNLRFDAGLFFAGRQVEAEYDTDREEWPDGAFRESPFLPHRGSFRRMVSLGDSITEGYNASGYIGGAPFRKPYAGRVAEALNAELINLGKNGASSSLLGELTEKTVGLHPDLITIAFGMNDLMKYSPEQYVDNIASGVRSLKNALPFACVVVVTPMCGNPEWSRTPVETARAFAFALHEWATREKVVCADLFSVWDFVLSRKGFFSMTGNGVNHPNDFGHFLYAKTILATLDHH